MAIAGGFSLEDHIFKALALGAPYFKAVCMGRALMIPAIVGKNASDEWQVINGVGSGGRAKALNCDIWR